MANTLGDKATQVKGKAREMYGKATGQKSQQAKGKAENLKGKATEGVKNATRRNPR